MKLLLIGIGLMLLIFGCSSSKNSTSLENQMTNTSNPSMDKMDSTSESSKMNENGTMMNNGSAMNNSINMESSQYIPFTKAIYEKAKADKKIIFLEFYANWCPFCKTQAPLLEQAFSEIKDQNVIGFRVNYKDSDTDNDEIELAKQFGITYQHTHIILDKNGNVAKRASGEWSIDMIKSEIKKISG